jgi:DNA helicase II / ATP-dependent DNA helicase PcrA
VENIQHVLIDEFQDTNAVQYNLMRLFSQKCQAISIVGDPDQGIYGWRNACVGNTSQMRNDYSGVKVVNLEENYRSSESILKISMAVIEQDKARFKRKLVGTRGTGEPPVLRVLKDQHVEARWIAREIKRCIGLTGRMLTPGDFAILVRASRMTRPIESALSSLGLRYRMVFSIENGLISGWKF